MEKEHISVKRMWEDYLTSIGEKPEDSNKKYTSWFFTDNQKSADALGYLLLSF